MPPKRKPARPLANQQYELQDFDDVILDPSTISQPHRVVSRSSQPVQSDYMTSPFESSTELSPENPFLSTETEYNPALYHISNNRRSLSQPSGADSSQTTSSNPQNIRSTIFQDGEKDDDVDIVKGLRNAFGKGGMEGVWLSSAKSPTTATASSREPITHNDLEGQKTTDRTSFSRISRSFSPDSHLSQVLNRDLSPSRSVHIRDSNPSPNKSHFSSHNSNHSPIKNTSEYPARPFSPLEPLSKDHLSKAVKDFSNRLLTGEKSAATSTASRDSLIEGSSSLPKPEDDELTPLQPLSRADLESHSRSSSRPRNSFKASSDIESIPSARLRNESSYRPLNSDESLSNSLVDQYNPYQPSSHRGSFSDNEFSRNRNTYSVGVFSDLSPQNTSSQDTAQFQHELLASASGRPILNSEEKTETQQPKRIELVGTSLKIFSKDNRFRIFLYKLLHKPWVSGIRLFVLFAHMVALTAMTAPDVFSHPTVKGQFSVAYRSRVYDWIMFIIYLYYTIFFIMNIIAYGLIFDTNRGKKDFTKRRYFKFSMPDSVKTAQYYKLTPTIFTVMDAVIDHLKSSPTYRKIFGAFGIDLAKRHEKKQTLHRTLQFKDPNVMIAPERAYLRSTWSRIDLIAIISYWISSVLLLDDTADKLDIFVFKCLTGIPILRILNLTKRTNAILRSLKAGSTKILTIFLFIAFFW